LAVASSSNAYAIPFSSCSRLLQSKQVVKEQDQQIIFVVEKGYLRHSFQRMLGIEVAKKCVVDQLFFYYQNFHPKTILKFLNSKIELFLETFSH
jgi:hypothetical protein